MEALLSALHIGEDAAPDLAWPVTTSVSKKTELELLKAVLPWTDPPDMRQPVARLPDAARRHIADAARLRGVRSAQAFALRRSVLKCLMPMREFVALEADTNGKGTLISSCRRGQRCKRSNTTRRCPTRTSVHL